ncbi:Os02g0459400 [Oryza sativa Japonica Group]|uniref:Os02g0459400 protein n=2 Tax=Oryza TaxID=4527 RepID=Q6K3K3_ORYSJ|nr:hypothetical protein DAI22_02g160600 [Oryza sativa Japonica Group]BAD19983.1 unknown protein [Oryza sativa Japonica Group]BAF08698.1 Os02g0459400 [Oryza sativa Japonica Group]|eukprot:NP_001046784.1 Os02g0459400 [Oryza sativa Japonica Group]
MKHMKAIQSSSELGWNIPSLHRGCRSGSRLRQSPLIKAVAVAHQLPIRGASLAQIEIN